jgi:hypothetical protein
MLRLCTVDINQSVQIPHDFCWDLISFVQGSDDVVSDSSGDVPILISSEEDLQPYDDANADDDVYDADLIIDECVRNVSVEHSNLSGNRLRVGSSCKHYLVKWAGYDASQSTWTPACMCSNGLVELYLQKLSRVAPPIEIRAPAIPDARAAGGSNGDPHPLPTSAAELRQRRIAYFQPQPCSVADPVAGANPVPDAPIPAATVPSSNASKKRPRRQVQVYADVGALHPEATIHTLKARIKELNPDCDVRVRGRDRVQQKKNPSIVTDTVRLGCKHVAGVHPCQLSIYCDVFDGCCRNTRRYTPGTCGSNVCICCQANQSDEINVYKCSIGHLVCSSCISIMVLSEVQGEKAPLFMEKQEMKCSFCHEYLQLASVIPLLTPQARAAYSSALCSVAALQAEKDTERRMRIQIQQAQAEDPQSIHFKNIENMILPSCPCCKMFLPDFDGCCALQCGHVSGSKEIAGGCGAHVCAWCQKDFLDGHTCHQHVLTCKLNPTGIPAASLYVFCLNNMMFTTHSIQQVYRLHRFMCFV